MINMGTGNYNSSMQLELFKKKGMDFEPDWLILVHFVNDVEPTPKVSKTLHFLKSQSYLYAVISGKYLNFVSKFSKDLHLENYYSSIYQEGSDNLLANTQALEEFVSLTSRGDIKLMIVNFPDLRKLEDYPFDYATERVKDFAQKNVVLFLDLLPEFVKYDFQELWVSWEDSHHNVKAHEIAAELIYGKLSEESVLKPKNSDRLFGQVIC